MESSRSWPWPRGTSRPANGVLGLGSQVLGLGLGLGKKFQLFWSVVTMTTTMQTFEVIAVFLLWTASHWYWRSERCQSSTSTYSCEELPRIRPPTERRSFGRCMESCAAGVTVYHPAQTLRTSSVGLLLLRQPQLNACLATVASSWDHTELGWGIGCWHI